MSSTTAVELTEEVNTSYIQTPPAQWNIPSRQDHPHLDKMLKYISQEQIADYEALCQLSKCTPTDHFTHLCSYLCMDRAAQYLSGNVQTVHFEEPDIEDLF